MALTDSYSTKALLKTRLGITDVNDDAALDSALAASSRAIEGITGRNFNDAGSASARVYYPDDIWVVTVDDFSTLTGLIVKGDYGNDGVYETTIAAANYQAEPFNGVVEGTPGWPFYRIRTINTYWPPIWPQWPRPSIEITAQWGWTAVPAPVTEACLILAEETFKMKDAPWGVAGFTEFGAVRVRENPKVAALLMRYIRNPILIA